MPKGEYDNRNSGALFRNKNMREGKKDPNLQGKVNVVCVHCDRDQDYWISGWTKVYGDDNEKMISLAIGKPVEQQKKPAKLVTKDEDIPF